MSDEETIPWWRLVVVAGLSLLLARAGLAPLSAHTGGCGGPQISVELDPSAVYPRSTPGKSVTAARTTVTVTVLDYFGKPCGGMPISMGAGGGWGGHDHNSGRPVGIFRPPAGETDDETGQFTTVYEASRFGGEETIAAHLGEGPIWSCNFLTVRVPNLVALGAGSYYDLVGQTATHPVNHYGTSTTNTALQNIATCFHNKYPEAPDLDYNDISLVKGGLFDISAEWATPHETHRVGKNCDCSNADELTTAQKTALSDCIDDAGGDWDHHNCNHWHLTFP